MDINIFQLAMEEQSGGGRGVVATVKKDWPKIWPPQLESNRMYAFDCFAKFWGRALPAPPKTLNPKLPKPETLTPVCRGSEAF